MKRAIDGVTVELITGDITKQNDVEAIVNAANAELETGGGVAGAIHRAAGPDLAEECRPMAPLEPGQAVISSGHNLPNSHVIHCLGPVHGRDTPSDKLLADAYRNALALAEDNGIGSIAFPAISTGAFGYPMREAATVAFRTIQEEAAKLKSVRLIRFVLYDSQALETHQMAFEDSLSEA